ncbi:MAG TPA: thiamine phosphate synthase, partial [Anaeromyxobacteraceae bacterium]|nr:thiamine phosphate synthase [Anaeromyxobacteraceae bacterium]
MTGRRRLAGFYFVTDAALSRAGNASDVRSAVAAGVAAVQYRAKAGRTRELCREAAELRALCPETLFIVNDRVDVALAVGADGVHVGQDDLPCAAARRLLGEAGVVGVSVRS